MKDIRSQLISGLDNKQNILDIFDQTQEQIEQLTTELLICYDQLNSSFAAVTALGRCRIPEEGIDTLMQQVSTAINSWQSYYIGRPPYPNLIEWKNPDSTNPNNASFLKEHRPEINNVINSLQDHIVCMIDYQGQYDQDQRGRGNVLAVKLNSFDTEQENLGTFVFVRGDHQDMFAAVDMNLAAALVKMGTAVLDNIIYARKLDRAYFQTVTALVRAIEAKDAYTCGHSTRVAEFARILGQKIGMSPQQTHWLEWAGLLHDIGKIGINDQVLTKPGRLTDEEFDQIKSHPEKSYKVLEPIEALGPSFDAVRHHHEHYDGGGYPDGLAGEDIPLTARVLQIADVWDALTSTRSYRKALSTEKALTIMREEAGTTIDPNIFKHFEKLILENHLPTSQ